MKSFFETGIEMLFLTSQWAHKAATDSRRCP